MINVQRSTAVRKSTMAEGLVKKQVATNWWSSHFIAGRPTQVLLWQTGPRYRSEHRGSSPRSQCLLHT